MRIYIYLFALLPLLFSCSSDAPVNAEPSPTFKRNDFYGVWQGVSFKARVNAGLGIEDSITSFEIQEANWEQTLSVKPVLTYYYADSTFRQEFISLDGVVYDSIRGLWNVMGDTILLISPQATYQYKFSMNAGLSEYRGFID